MTSSVEPRLPSSTQRLLEIGRTGTGKTVAGLFHLSNYPLQRDAWIVLDFKTDEHINSIEDAHHIDYSFIPKMKDHGLFILHPTPFDTKRVRPMEPSVLETYLWKLWQRENIGIFCDEGFMVGSNEAFESCLVQGRSKYIPMIVCTQRPAWLTRFAFSEADFFQVFHLNDVRDQRTVESFVPVDLSITLEEHQSWFFDVGKNRLFKFNPVPDMDFIRGTFHRKLGKHRRWLI